jgi:hypothetical protein
MAGNQETVTTAAAVTAGGDLVPRASAEPPGPTAIAADLLARTRAELPVLAGLSEREELLAAAWLASLRAPRTRRAYASDIRGWLGWLTEGERGFALMSQRWRVLQRVMVSPTTIGDNRRPRRDPVLRVPRRDDVRHAVRRTVGDSACCGVPARRS